MKGLANEKRKYDQIKDSQKYSSCIHGCTAACSEIYPCPLLCIPAGNKTLPMIS